MSMMDDGTHLEGVLKTNVGCWFVGLWFVFVRFVDEMKKKKIRVQRKSRESFVPPKLFPGF